MKIRLSLILSLLIAAVVAAADFRIDSTAPDGSKLTGTLTLTPPTTLPIPPVPATRPIEIVPQTKPVLLPAMVQRTAPAKNVRGDGFRIPPAQTTATAFVADGWEQNVVVENHPLPTTLYDFFSVRSHPQLPEPEGTYRGQGFYANKCGPIVIDGYYARQSGWQQGQPPQKRDRFRHHIYSNFECQGLIVRNSWLDDAACAAIQSRGPAAEVEDCFLTANGIAMLFTSGAKLKRITIYGGHCYYFPADPATGKPASWAGDVALQAYYPVDMEDIWIVGKPGQGADVTSIPGLKTYHLGAIVSGGNYGKPEWTPPKDSHGNRITKLVTARNCRIVGWPGESFAGASPHDGSGFIVAGRPVDVNAEIDAIRSLMETRQITIKEAVARAQAVVREAARKTLPSEAAQGAAR